MGRLKYLDALRGLAIIFMVLNHVGHYATAQPVTLPIYFFIYLTVTLAGPLFLFIAGYAAFLSYQKNPGFIRFAKRSLILVIGWLLVNWFFYYDEPLWRGRILLTIGLSSILIYPLLKQLTNTNWLKGLTLTAILGLLFFPGLSFLIASINQPILKDLLASEFPLYPWFLVLVLGAAGAALMSRLPLEKQPLAFKRSALGGAVLVLAWFFGSWFLGRRYFFVFNYDYAINNYWAPSFLTWLWIFGWILIFFYWGYRWFNGPTISYCKTALVSLGRQSLLFYFLQFFIIITIVSRVLAIKASTWSGYLLISLIIISILCCLAKSKIFAKIMAFGRQKLTGRIS